MMKKCNCTDEEHERLSKLSPEEQEIEQSLRGCDIDDEKNLHGNN
jgi:hypothetical protein